MQKDAQAPPVVRRRRSSSVSVTHSLHPVYESDPPSCPASSSPDIKLNRSSTFATANESLHGPPMNSQATQVAPPNDPPPKEGQRQLAKPRSGSIYDLPPAQNQRTGRRNSSTATSSDASDRQRLRKLEKHSKVVTDPVTGKEERIVDAKYQPPPAIPRTDRVPFPPDEWKLYKTELRNTTYKLIAFVVGAFLVLNGWLSLPYWLTIPLVLGAAVIWQRTIESRWLDIVYNADTEVSKERVLGSDSPGKESVEWLNSMLEKLWPQVNADLFAPVVDLLEDVMQASLPSVISHIKIANIGQGKTPMRVLSMRWLEAEEMPGGFGGAGTEELDPLDFEGDWVSLEIAFAYRGQKSSHTTASKAKNLNLLVNFFVGLGGIMEKAMPVWVELKGVAGICRVKVQLIPDPPFIKLGTFTLMGMPKIELSAIPLNQHFVNVMNLPLLSDFVYSSVRAAAHEFVAPASYTLDLSKLLVGDDSKKVLQSIGILVVNVHSAYGLRPADINNKSDCYTTLSFSKFAKPLWSSRIIFRDLNPVWDETAILVVGMNELKAKERLRVELWDSDRFTADDILGVVSEVDITQLTHNPGRQFVREDSLKGLSDGQIMPGKVRWSVAYYGLKEMNRALASDEIDERLNRIPETLKDLKKEHTPLAQTPTEVSFIPPDPAYPSGIVSIQVHNIVGLQRHRVTGTKGTGTHGLTQATEEEAEESENLPSSYCSIILDNQKIYRTRVKPMSSMPFFNAGTERFIRDWRYSTVMITIRDSRLRESDPILGVVYLPLREVFAVRSHICRYYPIRGGIGYGKIRVTMLFRSVAVQLPRPLIGSDVASIEISSSKIISKHITDPEVATSDTLVFRTRLAKRKAVRAMDQSGWIPVHSNDASEAISLGVRHRHSSSCILYFRRHSRVRKDRNLAVGVIWLKDLPDEEDIQLQVPIFKPKNLERFVQNCAPEEDPGHQKVGFIEINVRVTHGLGRSHRRAAAQDNDFADVLEAWKAIGHVQDEDQNAPSVMSQGNLTDSELSGEEMPGLSKRSTARLPVERLQHDSGHESGGVEDSGGENVPDDGGGGGVQKRWTKLKEERKELHRQERGVMQWKGARTLAWMGKGVRNKGRDLKKKFNMEPRRPDVESEV